MASLDEMCGGESFIGRLPQALNVALDDPDPLIQKLSVECLEYVEKVRSGSVPTGPVN